MEKKKTTTKGNKPKKATKRSAVDAAAPGSPWLMRIVEMLDYALKDTSCDGVMLEVRTHGADYSVENDEWTDMQCLDGCEFSTTDQHGDVQITFDELRQLRALLSGNDQAHAQAPRPVRPTSEEA